MPTAYGAECVPAGQLKGDAEMVERQMLTVPDLVGQPVHIAQEMAVNIGFGLAAGDPDRPGLRSRTWPGLCWVTSQDPSAGSLRRGAKLGLLSFRTVRPEATCRSRRAGRPPHLRVRLTLKSTSEISSGEQLPYGV
jgi:hypothetical protein